MHPFPPTADARIEDAVPAGLGDPDRRDDRDARRVGGVLDRGIGCVGGVDGVGRIAALGSVDGLGGVIDDRIIDGGIGGVVGGIDRGIDRGVGRIDRGIHRGIDRGAGPQGGGDPGGGGGGGTVIAGGERHWDAEEAQRGRREAESRS